jgi:hypothetical protein
MNPGLADNPLLGDIIEQRQSAQGPCVQDQALAGKTGNRIGQYRPGTLLLTDM